MGLQRQVANLAASQQQLERKLAERDRAAAAAVERMAAAATDKLAQQLGAQIAAMQHTFDLLQLRLGAGDVQAGGADSSSAAAAGPANSHAAGEAEHEEQPAEAGPVAAGAVAEPQPEHPHQAAQPPSDWHSLLLPNSYAANVGKKGNQAELAKQGKELGLGLTTLKLTKLVSLGAFEALIMLARYHHLMCQHATVLLPGRVWLRS
jgi:hypothetical protein